MRRRWLIPAGVSLLVVLASVLWFNGASITSAFDPSPAGPTPSAQSDNPAPPGGIGNQRAEIEKVYGTPTGLSGTMIGYENGKVAATYQDNRAVSLLFVFPTPEKLTLQEAHDRVQALLPTDVSFVGTLGAGPGRTAEIYHSNRLAKYVPPLKTGDVAGAITVVYQMNASGQVTQALLNVGTVSRSTAGP